MTDGTPPKTSLLSPRALPERSIWPPRGVLSIRGHLALLAAATLAPLLLFSGYALWRFANVEQRHYEQRLRQAANDLADDIDRTIDGMVIMLRTLATSPALQREDWTEFHARAQAALTGTPFGVIVVDPASLQTLVNTLVPFGSPLPRTADSATPARVLATKRPEVSNLFIGALINRPFLNVDVPVVVGGEVKLILLMTFEPSYIRDILKGQALQPGWVTGVSDGNGMVIARSEQHDLYVNTRLPDELFQRRHDATVFSARNLDGTEVLRAVARLRNADWVVAATVSRDVALEARLAYLWTLGAIGSLATLLSLALAYGVSRLLSGSVRQLAAAARSLGGGAPLLPVRTAVDEVNEVHRILEEAQRLRTRSEDDLRVLGERLAIAARVAGVASATVEHSHDGTTSTLVSADLAQILGLGDTELRLSAAEATSLVHPDDRAAVRAAFAETSGTDGDGHFNIEHRIVRPDGGAAWLNVRSTTFFSGEGVGRRPRLTVVAVRDVTGRKEFELALQETTERLQLAMTAGRMGAWETDFVNDRRTGSAETNAILGTPDRPLTTPEFEQVWHPDDRHVLAENRERLHAGQNDINLQYRIVRPDGSVRWVMSRGRVITRTVDGRAAVSRGILIDITPQKLAEEAVRESEARFRMLAEAVPNIAWTATPDGVLEWHSPRWTEYTGLDVPQVGASDWSGPIHEDDRAPTIAAWQRAAASGQTYEIEHRIRGRDGLFRWFLSRAVPVRDEASRITKWVGTATNIHAQKETEANLARYVAVADAAHDALMGTTLDGRIEIWSSGAQRLFGYSSSEMVGRPLAMLVPEGEREAHRALVDRVRQGESVGPIEVKRVHKDGSLLDVAASMSSVRDEHGTPVAIAKVAHDIRERLEVDDRLRLLNRELSHRVKNAFAVIQAIMRATARSTPDPKAFSESFSGRLQSMAAAHDLLTERNWRSYTLKELAERQIGAHANVDGRIVMNGPHVELSAELAVPLGLVLHELATNAAKYGALSVADGRVAVSWTIDATGVDQQVTLVWKETGGPIVAQPSRRGFGSVLVEQGVANGKVERRFEPDGVVCTIVLPLNAG